MTPRAGAIDVLVVGLGPAGASAAAAAATRGARVFAIDRKRQAGVPVQCAELVPSLMALSLPWIAAHARQSITGMRTFIEDAAPEITDPFPGLMIDRATFDAALVEEARTAGAAIGLDLALRSTDSDGVATLSDGRTVAARVIIGADGPHSGVGRAIGAVNRIVAETRQVTVPLRAPSDTTDIFLSGDLPGGYGWCFPKGTVANVGLGGTPAVRPRFKPLLQGLLDRLERAGLVGGHISCITGGAIPCGGMIGPAGRLGGSDVLLAGDAAGLANPVSGAGINAAVLSGRLAGEAAAGLANGQSNAAAAYAEEIGDLLAVSLERALRRREAQLAIWETGRLPSAAEHRRGWIAFPEYWAA